MLALNFSPFPELMTERLILRQIKHYDAEDLYSLRSDERVMKYIDKPRAKSEDEIRNYIVKITESFLRNEAITWGISLHRSFQLIGTIGFWRIMKEQHRAEIGLSLSPDFHGKGYMQEAL